MSEEIKTENKKPNYRIFHLTPDRKKKICDAEVYFEEESQIIEHTDKLRSESDVKYYWEPIMYVGLLDDDNRTLKEEMEMKFSYANSFLKIKEEDKRSIWKKVIDFVTSIPYVRYRISDRMYDVKYAFQRMFFKYDVRTSWNVGFEILNLIKDNVPKMVENLNGCPTEYTAKARALLNKTTEDEAAKSFNENHNETTSEMEVAMGLWKGDLLTLVNNCKLLTYYENHGIQDVDDEDWVDPHKYPIPMKKNSFVPDFVEVEKLYKKTSDEVFEFLKEHWNQMWD